MLGCVDVTHVICGNEVISWERSRHEEREEETEDTSNRGEYVTEISEIAFSLEL